MKKILITGASGFIGGFLVEEALKEGWQTWAGVRGSSNRKYLQDKDIQFINLDFSNKEKLKQQIIEHILEFGTWDYIIHNAGVTQCLHLSDFDKINFLNTVHFIEALQETGNIPEKFILMSSLSAKFPKTAYGGSKQKAENYIQSLKDFPSIIMRPTGVYGPREKDYYLMLKTIQSGLDVGAGFKTQYLTFIYVTDLVKAVYLALKSNMTNRIYEVSDGKVYTDSEYTKLAKETLGKSFVIRFKVPLWLLYIISVISEFFFGLMGKTSTLNRDKYKIMKQRDWKCDNQPLISDLGFKPEYDLVKGLKASVDWYRENGMLR